MAYGYPYCEPTCNDLWNGLWCNNQDVNPGCCWNFSQISSTPSRCILSDQCPPGVYVDCYELETQEECVAATNCFYEQYYGNPFCEDACEWLLNETYCSNEEINPLCCYDHEEGCLSADNELCLEPPDCWDFDNDQDACTNSPLGCFYEIYYNYGYCEPTCNNLLNETWCTDVAINPGCCFSPVYGNCREDPLGDASACPPDEVYCTNLPEAECVALEGCYYEVYGSSEYCERKCELIYNNSYCTNPAINPGCCYGGPPDTGVQGNGCISSEVDETLCLPYTLQCVDFGSQETCLGNGVVSGGCYYEEWDIPYLNLTLHYCLDSCSKLRYTSWCQDDDVNPNCCYDSEDGCRDKDPNNECVYTPSCADYAGSAEECWGHGCYYEDWIVMAYCEETCDRIADSAYCMLEGNADCCYDGEEGCIVGEQGQTCTYDPSCSDYLTEADCNANNCYFEMYNGYGWCERECGGLLNETHCNDYGSCCFDIPQSACVTGNQCVIDGVPCSTFNSNQTECKENGCFYERYGNKGYCEGACSWLYNQTWCNNQDINPECCYQTYECIKSNECKDCNQYNLDVAACIENGCMYEEYNNIPFCEAICSHILDAEWCSDGINGQCCYDHALSQCLDLKDSDCGMGLICAQYYSSFSECTSNGCLYEKTTSNEEGNCVSSCEFLTTETYCSGYGQCCWIPTPTDPSSSSSSTSSGADLKKNQASNGKCGIRGSSDCPTCASFNESQADCLENGCFHETLPTGTPVCVGACGDLTTVASCGRYQSCCLNAANSCEWATSSGCESCTNHVNEPPQCIADEKCGYYEHYLGEPKCASACSELGTRSWCSSYSDCCYDEESNVCVSLTQTDGAYECIQSAPPLPTTGCGVFTNENVCNTESSSCCWAGGLTGCVDKSSGGTLCTSPPIYECIYGGVSTGACPKGCCEWNFSAVLGTDTVTVPELNEVFEIYCLPASGIYSDFCFQGKEPAYIDCSPLNSDPATCGMLNAIGGCHYDHATKECKSSLSVNPNNNSKGGGSDFPTWGVVLIVVIVVLVVVIVVVIILLIIITKIRKNQFRQVNAELLGQQNVPLSAQDGSSEDAEGFWGGGGEGQEEGGTKAEPTQQTPSSKRGKEQTQKKPDTVPNKKINPDDFGTGGEGFENNV